MNDSFTELKGEIAGPPDTPYEGGNFVLEIKVPETYPFNPPKVRILPVTILKGFEIYIVVLIFDFIDYLFHFTYLLSLLIKESIYRYVL